jgi:hypothetical protein
MQQWRSRHERREGLKLIAMEARKSLELYLYPDLCIGPDMMTLSHLTQLPVIVHQSLGRTPDH